MVSIITLKNKEEWESIVGKNCEVYDMWQYVSAFEKNDDGEATLIYKKYKNGLIYNIVFKRNISFVREFDNGACDVKDLITFYNVVKKGNFSFLEPFHTPYFIGDVYLKCLFSSIPTNQMSLLGGMYEKQKAFLHEYPSKKEEFSKFGCDPKQYHHIVRLYDIIKYAENKNTLNFPFLRYCGEGAEYMKKIKRDLNGLTVEQIQKDIEMRIEEAKAILDNKQYKFQEVNLEEEVGFYLKQKIKEALLNEQI